MPGLKTILLPNQYNGDTAGVHGAAGDNCLTADTPVALAVSASSCDRARGFGSYPDAVRRCGYVPDSANAVLYRGNHLVHAGNYQHMGRALNKTGNPVAVSVHVNQFSIQGDSVGAGEKIICGDDSAVEGSGFFRIFS